MMFHRVLRRTALLFVVLASVSGGVGHIPSAQAFAVSPVLFDRTLDPGSSEQGIIQVVNDTKEDQTYYASIQNFVPQGEEGQQTFLPDTDTSGLVTWITLDRESVRLKAGEVQEFRWSLNLPKNAEAGGHYAAIFFSTIPASEQGSSGVGVGAKTGVLFLVNVNGPIQEKASIESFSVMSDENISRAIKTGLINHLPAFFELRIRNDGSVHFIPQGKIVVSNVFGNTITEVGMNPQGNRVLPGSTRKIHSSWGGFIPGGESFMDQLRAEWKGFAIGRYTATVQGSYGKQSAPLSASVSFWVFPWRVMLSAFCALLVLVVIVKIYNKLVIRSALSKVGQKK